MAGHSHWAGIKHKKAIVDKKRGKLFSKIAKQIITAVRKGGKDPDTNLALRAAIDSEAEDAVGACLGLELSPLSVLSEVPEVLTSKWLARVDDTNDMQRLSVR